MPQEEMMDMEMNNTYFGSYDTRKFTDVFPSVEEFLSGYNDADLPFKGSLSDEKLTLLYYLLYSRYGNSHWANYDEMQAVMKLYSIIYINGPTWAKREEIQKSLRELSEDQLVLGAKSIYNHSFNPGTEPSTATLEELTTINDQNTSTIKRSKLDAYATLWEVLKVDITSAFLDKFKVCFLSIVEPQRPLYYETEI